MIFVPRLSSANNTGFHNFFGDNISLNANYSLQRDTVSTKNAKQHQTEEEKKKIKEVTNAKRQPKPEKIEAADNAAASQTKHKPKRLRRPEGLERPPEIPRRNGN